MLRRDDQQLIKKAEEIARLLFKEMNGELSASERQTLNEWLDKQDPSTLEFFGDVTDRSQLDKDLQAYSAIDVNKALKDVQKRIASSQPGAEGEIMDSPPRRRKFALLAMTILGILFASAVMFIYLRTKRKTTIDNVPVAQQLKNDVAPGSDKAVLTLADGSQITLDKAANGQLARQGATQVMKLDAGKLAYNTASSKEQAPIQIAYNTISTPRGGQYQVLLPDGSKVWLNAASSLRFPTAFSGKERRVELSGEAYFEISQNPSLPFKVSIAPPSRSDNGGGAGTYTPLEVEVLGTAFDVEAYAEDGDQRATLVSGAVKVINGAAQSVLKPGQQARVKNTPGAALQVAHVDTDEITAWKDGKFLFQSATIESIMRQLARWYDVDVKYEGEKPVQRLTGNVSRNNNLSDILRVLEISGYHFEIQGRMIVVKN
jgi:transmembrane sensor